MPVDEFGNRAEVIFNDLSIIKRMNTGNLWEHELNAVLDQFRVHINDLMNIEGYTDDIWNELMDFYQVVSPAYYDIVVNGITYRQDKIDHIEQFIDGVINLYLPYGSVKVGSEHSKAIAERYPLKYGKVSFITPSGEKVVSKSDILISKLYMMRLEKIGENWAATSVPRRQHHGIISKLSSVTKTLLPYRNQSIRFGETEVRNMMSTATPLFPTALLSLANNAELSSIAVKNILEAENPVRIPEVIPYQDLESYPSVAIDRINHLMFCFGLTYEYMDERQHTYEVPSVIDADHIEFEYTEDDD